MMNELRVEVDSWGEEVVDEAELVGVGGGISGGEVGGVGGMGV